ncbi:pancreatic triacylglycerol lipase-like [Diabrotica undecimpunctata]|uniref:pancreatic triacylglycerol lipase-like n=1 Tax=Diabrotica undecimpunctata TaxID=50387 RepID=UPI003B6396CE
MQLRFFLVLYFFQKTQGLFPLSLLLNRQYKYSPPENDITFYLFHRSNLSTPYQLLIGDTYLLQNSKFDPQLSTKIIIHGWTHDKDTPWVQELKDVLATSGSWNVIVVDWGPLSHSLYVEVRVHNYVVTKQVKTFMHFLADAIYYPMSSIHFIGHSMGAQIAAGVGCFVQSERNEKIGRITGLDPAGPLYEWPHIESLDEVLDPTDATFVDVIHTNGRYVGMMSPAGHVDYYPNGGEQQWMCELWSCSHIRVCELFIASVRKPDLFKAFSFQSWMKYVNGSMKYLEVYPMGLAATPDIPNGIYFLEVNNEYKDYVSSKTTLIDSYGFYFGEWLNMDIINSYLKR